MVCNQCGTPNEDQAAFCANCGNPLTAPVAEPVVEAAPAAEPVVEAAPAAEPVVEAAPAAEPVQQAPYTAPYTAPVQNYGTPVPNPAPYSAPVQQPVYGEPVQEKPAQPGKGFAIAGMVCGIVSFFCFAIVTGILGIAFGAVAKSKGYKGGMATAGIVCGAIGLALWLVLLIFGGCATVLAGI